MRNKILLVMSIVLICTIINSCGSSGSQDETMNWLDESVTDISTNRPSNEALVAAKSVISGFENSSQQSLDSLNNAQDSVAYGVEPMVLKFGKMLFKEVVPMRCETNGSQKYTCFINVPAPRGGYAAMIFYVEYDEDESDYTSGKMNVEIEFYGYQLEDDCRNWVDIEGFMYCSTEFQSAEDSYNFSGKCDTSNDPDGFINVWVGADKHLIGVFSVISFTESTSSADGVMSIDGVNYSFDDVKSASVDICE